ncbi:MAG: putative 4-hydroxybenzoate polyprenyltransferase [Pirellulales bacterium]|nr:putative 4-hydroxybenzoate polyprenyltransferase [Pirellulales bacterium]
MTLRGARHFLEMIRFSHTLFALPFALLSAILAWNENARAGSATPFRWQELVGIVLCMVFARSAAMAFNRLADRAIDARNPRTKMRHLPAGILSTRSVWVMAIVCAAGFVASTLLFLPNWWPLYLSAPVLAFLLGYSYAKRFTALAHYWLGAALMLAPIAAWIAIRGSLGWPPLVLGGAVLLWVAGFDIIYACQDFEFDRQAGLHSVPVWLGVPGALRLSAWSHLGMVALLALLPLVYGDLDKFYWLGLGIVAALLVYEHWLVRPDDLDRVNLAFFHVNWIISLLLLVVCTVDLLT